MGSTCGPTTTPSCTRWPGSMTASRAGGSRGETYAVAEQLAAYGEEPGSDSATATSPRTSSGRPACGSGPADRGRPRPPAGAGGRRPILPMADEPVRTLVRTDDGWLEFQEYFVHRHQAPTRRRAAHRRPLRLVHGRRAGGSPRGRAPAPLLDEIAAAPDHTALARVLGRRQREGRASLVGSFVSTDAKDPNRYLVHLTSPASGCRTSPTTARSPTPRSARRTSPTSSASPSWSAFPTPRGSRRP